MVGGAGNLGRAFVEGLKLKSHRAFVWDKKEGLLNLSVDTLANWHNCKFLGDCELKTKRGSRN